MNILGGRVTRFEAKRIEDNATESIGLNIDVKDVSNESKVVKIVYSSKISYVPNVAEISVDGELVIDFENEQKAKEMVESFKKEKRLPTGVAEEVIQAINYSATSVGTMAAFAIGLGAPISIPKVKISEVKPGATPKAG
ncbi:hypothetical protein AUJ14_04150 [Candidatus Micrarchaeota archaeon CG1_02_55_22]|nr:MAG: hypothetical protein AUJ14_04150 [Candidatus Micrarchaeota archaeon CG1_02_55_22]